MENRFNLVTEPWIPVAGKGKVGLKNIFEDNSIIALGGNPVEKIAVFKLLLAIGQSCFTPKDESEWKQTGKEGFRKLVLEYLKKNINYFWLYGDKPFLQLNEVKKAQKKSFGDVQMHIATGNTTVVTEIQSEKETDDAEKALILLTLMGFAFGGKKTDNTVVLTQGYKGKQNEKGKTSSGKFGPSLDFMGLQHSFFMSGNICNSVYINLFTDANLIEMNMFPNGVGIAPWEKMPQGEDDDVARMLKTTYMGRLIPVNRFCLIEGEKLHYTEGILHSAYADFIVDPSVSVDFNAKPKPKVLWSNPEKKPWRTLPSLLAFINTNNNKDYICNQLKFVSKRLIKENNFTIWSAGVKVSSNAGEQYLTGTDDFVESEIQLEGSIFNEASMFFDTLCRKMEELDSFNSKLYGAINRYYLEMKMEAKNIAHIAQNACNTYWQLCEGEFQNLINICFDANGETKIKDLMKKIYGFVLQIYDETCPNQTARQLEAWAKNKPFNKVKEEK